MLRTMDLLEISDTCSTQKASRKDVKLLPQAKPSKQDVIDKNLVVEKLYSSSDNGFSPECKTWPAYYVTSSDMEHEGQGQDFTTVTGIQLGWLSTKEAQISGFIITELALTRQISLTATVQTHPRLANTENLKLLPGLSI